MEELFAAVKSGSVDEVKRIISETGLPPTVCNEVCTVYTNCAYVW